MEQDHAAAVESQHCQAVCDSLCECECATGEDFDRAKCLITGMYEDCVELSDLVLLSMIIVADIDCALYSVIYAAVSVLWIL